ncbi:Nop14-like protein [Xylariomycetidae sp. FL2044]|nr:Nop14-like protein [Xylariomycetidae sp. FL2044]KAH9902274.1 Nop14-like protein [Xylariomycetidae sp. FL2044]
MAGSQLKRLKASLREQGVIGPQQSKKQKRRNAQDGKANTNKRLQKAAALDSIREQFNPFDFKHNARGPKFEVTSNRPATGQAARGIQGRPGDAKAVGEERRRQTLLVEMNRRNKVGGILDRRFGENDPTMAPEEKMMQRFVREKQSHKKNSLFDLEDDEPNEGLTHFGKSLSFEKSGPIDDFDEDDLEGGSDDEQGSDDGEANRALKRMRSEAEDEEMDRPERKKTKQEVMKEIIAKSKNYKAERQEQKDADEDLREELDKELSDLQALLFMKPKDRNAAGTENGAASASGVAGKEKMERDYDMRLKLLAQDRRAQPTERTKTDEEKAQEELERLRELEAKRLQRMRGEAPSDSEGEGEESNPDTEEQPDPAGPLFIEKETTDEFGLGAGIKTRPTAAELGLEDEDSFVLDDDLIASSGSDLEVESDESMDERESDDEEDDEFTKGLLTEAETHNPIFSMGASDAKDDAIGFLLPCPETLDEFRRILEDIPPEQTPSVIQRIRLRYHPKLDSGNKLKLANFSKVLVRYLSSLSSQSTLPPFSVIESIIRHLHSLAKGYPLEVANEFRSNTEELGKQRPLSPDIGDLILLTAIGVIFPASDHYHQVATPAMLIIARFLGQKIPKQEMDFCQGAFLGTLALQFQHDAKRWVPEFMNFCLNALVSFAPAKPKEVLGYFPVHELPPGMRITNASSIAVRQLRPTDCIQGDLSGKEAVSTKIAIVDTNLQLLDAAADLFNGKPAFFESFQPVSRVLSHLASKACKSEFPAVLNERARKLQAKVEQMLGLARLARRPLELHHHKPLAIKTSIPKFEDSFDPHKHYDPDRDRAELAKLRAEHKKERKGAMRELRKDASFMAREKLRVKKQKDAAYEKKYKRLVAEIQGEEGREANAYDREKQMRQRAKKR